MSFYARVFFDFAIAFPARRQLMNLRTTPDRAVDMHADNVGITSGRSAP